MSVFSTFGGFVPGQSILCRRGTKYCLCIEYTWWSWLWMSRCMSSCMFNCLYVRIIRWVPETRYHVTSDVSSCS